MDLLGYLVALQGTIRASISTHLTDFAATRDWALLAAMLPLGIGFGAVHALTPGHGKMVLASYLISSRLAALRSLLVSTALALTHIGTAVLLALIGAPLISKALGSIGRAPTLEGISRGLLTAIGLWMLVRALLGPRRHAHDSRDGMLVGAAAGLIPCPLTLFAMVLATARGVPEAGLTFAAAMVGGVGLTLGVVALLTVIARGWMLALSTRHGTRNDLAGRVLDGLSGVFLLAIGLRELSATL